MVLTIVLSKLPSHASWLLGPSLGVKQSAYSLEQAECTLVSELEMLVLASIWHTHVLIQEKQSRRDGVLVKGTCS